jgi:hypothetical protein
MRVRTIVAIAAAVSALLTTTALAQSEPPGTSPPLAQPPAQSTCPPGSGGPRSNETTGSRPLSDRLADSKGVICPPAGVDPGITAPPVGGGRVPVIPPPGTPGGDPNIQPK